MFAVPGWSISSKNPKPERATSERTSKKRKRSQRGDEPVESAHIGDLWTEQVGKQNGIQVEKSFEGRSKLTKKEKKRLKREATSNDNIDGDIRGSPANENSQKVTEGTQTKESNGSAPPEALALSAGQEIKEDKKVKKRKSHENGDSLSQSNSSTITSAPHPVIGKTPPKLTPLQASMRQKLISSRFRHLNETLYTTPSSASLKLFEQNPEFFTEYHEGFRRQVEAWPSNPVDNFISWIKERGMVGLRNFKDIRRKTSRKSTAPPRQASNGDNDDDGPDAGPESLPRDPRKGICTIADLGCGEGKLGHEISTSNLGKKLCLQIRSYDLAASAPHITVADIRSLPLEDGSVDITIFCLALMGTNWIEFIEEAYRVLRWKGECWIAEVASRFAGTAKAKGKRVEHSVGKRQKRETTTSNQKADEFLDEDFGLVADASAPSTTSTTDLSAFIAVLRRRGFVLAGQPNTGNRMFVQMRFIKALPPLRGKGKQERRDSGRKKFIDEDADADISVEDEMGVLKPCVYKIR